MPEIMPGNKKLFCTKPFQWFEISRGESEGQVFLCCPAWLDTSVGNLNTQSVEQVWNGKMAQDIRRSILDGSFEYCSQVRCPYLQTVSGPVRRVEDVTDPEMRAIIDQQRVVLPYGPRDINCSYDRSCNLSCPTCRTRVIVESQRKEEILGIQQKLNDQALRDAKMLYITGSGDPFGSPFFRRWLQTMKRADMPQLEKIHLHTNAQLWTPTMWETIPAEIRALIQEADISVDAVTAETYAINRRGGTFERLWQNLEFISRLRANGPLKWVGLSMVVQENNFGEMPEFVRLAQRFNFNTAHFQQLVNWGTFTHEEFIQRAIHLPSHPRHHEFAKLLQHKIFEEPIVYLGNLTDVRRRSLSKRSWLPEVFKMMVER